MKTLIQELIDEMQAHYDWDKTTFEEKAGIALCIKFAVQKLAKEKRQLDNLNGEITIQKAKVKLNYETILDLEKELRILKLKSIVK